jgi:5-methylcytosine-specific restriction enzyme A
MLQKHYAGTHYVKKSYRDNLAKQFNRSPGAFERRMANISSIIQDLGYDFLPGYKPLSNVGSNIYSIIESEINKNLHLLNPDTHTIFELQVDGYRKQIVKQDVAPSGNINPKKNTSQTTSIERDPKVKAWVLENAKGICECCNKNASFIKENGLPYLEIHHMRRLKDDGPDTIANAVAICPNCHREIHYGKHSKKLIKKIYRSIKRLQEK